MDAWQVSNTDEIIVKLAFSIQIGDPLVPLHYMDLKLLFLIVKLCYSIFVL